jgi:hypothetical protein
MSHLPGYGRGVDEKGLMTGGAAASALVTEGAEEASRVLRRLERIEALDRERAPAGQLLGELRELVHEAEALARTGTDGRSRSVVAKLGEGAEGMH